MKTFLLLPSIILLSACGQQEDRANVSIMQKQGTCECVTSKNEINPTFFINAIGDSVVICEAGKMSTPVNGGLKTFNTWVDFLKHSSLAREGKVVDCKTGQPFAIKEYNYSIQYKDKKLIVLAEMQFDVYDEKTNTWKWGYQRPTYEQTIYAEEGNLKMDEAKMVLHPFPYNGKTIELVHKLFNDDLKINNHSPKYDLIRRLLGAALSGDKLSGERLLNFEKLLGENNDNKDFLKNHIAVWTAFKTEHHLN